MPPGELAPAPAEVAVGAIGPDRWRDVGVYLGLAFGATWTLHGVLALSGTRYSMQSPSTLLYLLGLLAPSTAALIVEHRNHGRRGVQALLASASARTSSVQALSVAFLGPVALTAIATVAARGSGSFNLEPAIVVGQLWVVTGEEFGWRGWLWPRAVARFGAALGTVAVTAVWAVWHAPMFLVAGSPQAKDGILAFTAAIAAWGLLHGALQVHRRSVFTAMVFHAAANVAASTFDVAVGPRAVVHSIAAAATLAWLIGQSRRGTSRVRVPDRVMAEHAP